MRLTLPHLLHAPVQQGSKGFEAKVEARCFHRRARPERCQHFSAESFLAFVWTTPRFLDIVTVSGGYIGGVTPVPIPNTEVKPSRADGTPRETAWESRSLPDFFEEAPESLSRTSGSVFENQIASPRRDCGNRSQFFEGHPRVSARERVSSRVPRTASLGSLSRARGTPVQHSKNYNWRV